MRSMLNIYTMRTVEESQNALRWWERLSDNQRYVYASFLVPERLNEVYPKAFNSGLIYFMFNVINN